MNDLKKYTDYSDDTDAFYTTYDGVYYDDEDDDDEDDDDAD